LLLLRYYRIFGRDWSRLLFFMLVVVLTLPVLFLGSIYGRNTGMRMTKVNGRCVSNNSSVSVLYACLFGWFFVVTLIHRYCWHCWEWKNRFMSIKNRKRRRGRVKRMQWMCKLQHFRHLLTSFIKFNDVTMLEWCTYFRKQGWLKFE
jgi:hypothetical protein